MYAQSVQKKRTARKYNFVGISSFKWYHGACIKKACIKKASSKSSNIRKAKNPKIGVTRATDGKNVLIGYEENGYISYILFAWTVMWRAGGRCWSTGMGLGVQPLQHHSFILS